MKLGRLGETDRPEDMWVVPATRMMVKREELVPLCGYATLSLLDRVLLSGETLMLTGSTASRLARKRLC